MIRAQATRPRYLTRGPMPRDMRGLDALARAVSELADADRELAASVVTREDAVGAAAARQQPS